MASLRIKTVSIVASAAAALTLAACGGDGEANAKGGGQPATEAQKQAYETFGLDPSKPYDGTKLRFLICCNSTAQFASLIKRTNEEFTPLTGIEVEWADVPYDAFLSQIVAEATTGAATYDLVAWVDAWGPSIKGLLEPLDERIDDAGIDMSDYPDAFLEASKAGTDEYLGIPMRGHAFMFEYRKDIYDKLGLEPPTTWDEFDEQAELIKSRTDLWPTAGYYGRGAQQNLFIWMSMLWSNGGDILDGDDAVFNSPEGVEAAERYTSWVDKGYVSPESVSWTETEARSQVTQGDAATFINWSHQFDRYTNPEEASPEVLNQMGFAPVPTFDGSGDSQTYAQVWPAGILKGSQDKDAAWSYLRWMTNPQTVADVATDKSDPMTSTVVAVNDSVLREAAVNDANNGLSEAMADSLENARTLPMVSEWPEISDVLEVAINEIALGADAQEELDKAADSVEDILSD